jgi:lambda repressor-like predicted transcriptional regulator
MDDLCAFDYSLTLFTRGKNMSLHWADIYAALYKKDLTPAKIARQEGVPLSHVCDVIKGKKTSHKVAYAVAAATGIPTEKMWPGRYIESPAEYKKLRGDNERGRLPEIRRAG